MHNNSTRSFFRSPFHRFLALVYGVIWVLMAINPVYRFDWALENLLVVITVSLMWKTYSQVRLSNASYTLIFVFMCLHTIGSHYTYAETPIGFWLQDWLALERNHYDRIIHFSFGLLIFWPMREVAELVFGARRKCDNLIGLLLIISMSALYEALEWVVAVLVEGDLALAFLGTQGDVFDAQKDHTLAISGGIISFLFATWLLKKGRLPKFS